MIVLETARLRVRTATPADAGLFLALWNDGRVMANVGFPTGLRTTLAEIEARLAREGEGPFERRLVVEQRADGQAIGECNLSLPNHEGVSGPDLKLLPAFWGQGYGREAWRALVDYQFAHTTCSAVLSTPNVRNLPSQRMMEAAGGVRVGEALFEFPESMRDWTVPVPHYIYRIERADWENR